MKRLSCLILLALLLAGCDRFGPPPHVCDELTRLRPLVGQMISAEALRDWVIATYQFPQERTRVRRLEEVHRQYVVWWTDRSVGVNTHYGVLLEGNTVTSIDVGVVGGTLADLTACAGLPEQYYADYSWNVLAGANELSLWLAYPSLGILVSGGRYYPDRPKQPPPITTDIPVSLLRLVPVAPTDQFLQDLRIRNWDIPFRSWPGAWEKMEIEIDPTSQIPL